MSCPDPSSGGAAVALWDPGGHPQPHTRTGAANPRDLRKDGGWYDYSRAIAVGGIDERRQLQSIRRGAQVLIATPGRLFDFLGRRLLELQGVFVLVLDEADRMLDMGFLPTIRKIMAAMPPDRQTLFFSATIETSVKHP
ncbi:MAG TPA: DEAD/DEAH box helicase [Bryobacteraceae bacterium]|nr:DEAD/DEAH box helicase [Bryobacteraceae bacterium]